MLEAEDRDMLWRLDDIKALLEDCKLPVEEYPSYSRSNDTQIRNAVRSAEVACHAFADNLKA